MSRICPSEHISKNQLETDCIVPKSYRKLQLKIHPDKNPDCKDVANSKVKYCNFLAENKKREYNATRKEKNQFWYDVTGEKLRRMEMTGKKMTGKKMTGKKMTGKKMTGKKMSGGKTGKKMSGKKTIIERMDITGNMTGGKKKRNQNGTVSGQRKMKKSKKQET